MIYVTADTHGERERFEEKSIRRLKKGDTLIVLGDFGFLWDGSKAEKKNLAWLARRRYKILFLDGCHDNYDLLKEYPLEDFCGGRARHIGGNLYHVLRGSVLELEGKKLLCFGGGESGGGRRCPPATSWTGATITWPPAAIRWITYLPTTPPPVCWSSARWPKSPRSTGCTPFSTG